MSTPDRLVELHVTGYANGGAGIARSDGRVVFVDGALPGERVMARITDDSQSAYMKAVAADILEASEHRIPPGCFAAAAGAGCCDLSYVAPEYARELGAAALSDVLTRIGHFDLSERAAPTVEALAEQSTQWRIRTRLAVGADGRAGLRGRGSSDIITVPCAAPVSGLLDDVDALGAAPGTELILIADADGHRHAAELSAPHVGRGRNKKSGRDGQRRGAQRTRGARSAPRTIRTLDGGDLVEHRVGGRTWQVPINGFWQAHRNAPQIYTDTALDMLAEVGIGGDVHAWDLYGGAGVFTAALLDDGPSRGFTVTGVDLVDSDAGSLKAAAETLGGDRVHAHLGGVAETLTTLTKPNVVISDPPRTGAGLSVVDGIVAANPDAIVHVGCDAASFARDLGRFTAQGYRVRSWRGFDAFPMTHHLEAIAVLTR